MFFFLVLRKYIVLYYYPEGNGVLEAFHQYLKRSLSILRNQGDVSIEEIIDFIMLAHNSTPHESTGETPFYIMTGTEFVLPNLLEITFL